jgi:predicted metalloprotease with PDZ domain
MVRRIRRVQRDRSISYYNKGQILGVLLDLAIRDATDNHKSLDDVLRRMNAEYAQQGKFYDESAGILSVVNEVAGRNFDDFFRRYVSGTDEIPYNDFLSIAGLELKSGGGDNSDINMPEGAHLSFTEIAHPTDRQRRIRNGLLTGSTD